MAIYGEQILPRIINVVCGTKPMGKIRREVCDGLHGDVLEIGFGSGHSLPYLPTEVTGLWTVDPSGTAMKLAAKRIAASPVPVHQAGRDGAHLDLPDERFDGALSTMTLCTIPDVASALTEVRRVLKPGGEFHFAEHGLAPDAKVARMQDRLNGLEQRVAGGCNLNREIEPLVTEAGFTVKEVRNFYMKGPKAFSYMTLGTAIRP